MFLADFRNLLAPLLSKQITKRPPAPLPSNQTMSSNPFNNNNRQNAGGPDRNANTSNKPGLSRQVSNCTRDLRAVKRENEALHDRVAELEKDLDFIKGFLQALMPDHWNLKKVSTIPPNEMTVEQRTLLCDNRDSPLIAGLLPRPPIWQSGNANLFLPPFGPAQPANSNPTLSLATLASLMAASNSNNNTHAGLQHFNNQGLQNQHQNFGFAANSQSSFGQGSSRSTTPAGTEAPLPSGSSLVMIPPVKKSSTNIATVDLTQSSTARPATASPVQPGIPQPDISQTTSHQSGPSLLSTAQPGPHRGPQPGPQPGPLSGLQPGLQNGQQLGQQSGPVPELTATERTDEVPEEMTNADDQTTKDVQDLAK